MQYPSQWFMACHLGRDDEGSVAIIRGDEGKITVTRPLTVKEGPAEQPPVYLGATTGGYLLLMDPASKQIQARHDLPANAFPGYPYRDPDGQHLWFMNDGDKETGLDELNCGSQGSSVTIIRHTGDDQAPAEHVKTICVGRGHHVTTFTMPANNAPALPRRAYVSNLMDGTLSVIGNDPDDTNSYLKVIDTLSLHDPQKDKDSASGVPNNAFPHGKVYSPVSGMLYSLNNGYGTVNIIDPLTNEIKQTVALPVSSNLLLSPDGRSVIGKGADRKSDPDHVIGRLTVMDAVSGEVHGAIDLNDFYPSTYRFNPDGSKLYVTSAATGKGTQRDNLKMNSILVFDTSTLPSISLIKEVTVGLADCGRRPIAFTAVPDTIPYVFVPNPTDATISILEGKDDRLIDTVSVADNAAKEFNFSFWDSGIYGA